MIVKDETTINGYKFIDPVTANEMEDLLKPLLHEFKGIIINEKTAKKYGIKIGDKFITLNKKVPDNMFFINNLR